MSRNRSPLRSRSDGRQGGRMSVAALAPYAVYDTNVGGSSTQITDSSANARAAMTVGASSASPQWLPYAGQSELVLAGSGCNITHTSPTGITGAVEVIFRQQVGGLSPWTVTGNYDLATDKSASGGWSFTKFSDGAIYYQFYTTGPTGNLLGTAFSVGVATIRNSPFVKLVGRPDIGGGLGRVEVHTSPDGTTWTLYNQTASAVTGGTTMLPSAIPLVLGKDAVWSLEAATVNNGVGGAAVASFDPALSSQSGYSPWTVTRPTTGGKSVVQSQAAISAESLFLLRVDDYIDGPTAAIPPCANAASASMFAVLRPWATQAANAVIFTTRSGTGAGVTLRMASATTIVADISDGTTTNTTPAVTFTPGLRAVVGVHLSAAGTGYVTVNNTAGSTVARPAGTQAGGVLRFGASSTPSNYLDAEVRVPWLALDRLATTNDIATATAVYGGGL